MNNGASGVSGFDSTEVIRINLERALESSPFATADRLRRFLRYIVEKSLSGQQEALREYAIGLEVYGRKPDFDPRVDAIVRVEASRLRGKLREYYDSAGRRDSIRIELPKGTFVPLFKPLADAARSNLTEAGILEPQQPESRFGRDWLRSPPAWLVIAACAGGLLYWLLYRGGA